MTDTSTPTEITTFAIPDVSLTVGPFGDTDVMVRLDVHFQGDLFETEQVISAQEVLSATNLDALTRQVVGKLFFNMGNALLNPPQS